MHLQKEQLTTIELLFWTLDLDFGINNWLPLQKHESNPNNYTVCVIWGGHFRGNGEF